MSREIKFRAWEARVKKYIDWDNFINNPFGTWGMKAFNNDRYHFQQYTGLKDKNGKEIYEGDILALEDYSPNWLVKYHYDAFIAEGGEFKTQEGLIEFYDWHNECLIAEIVGNIYENPELLEATA